MRKAIKANLENRLQKNLESSKLKFALQSKIHPKAEDEEAVKIIKKVQPGADARRSQQIDEEWGDDGKGNSNKKSTAEKRTQLMLQSHEDNELLEDHASGR